MESIMKGVKEFINEMRMAGEGGGGGGSGII